MGDMFELLEELIARGFVAREGEYCDGLPVYDLTPEGLQLCMSIIKEARVIQSGLLRKRVSRRTSSLRRIGKPIERPTKKEIVWRQPS
jgi:hypothetical protein